MSLGSSNNATLSYFTVNKPQAKAGKAQWTFSYAGKPKNAYYLIFRQETTVFHNSKSVTK